MNLPFYLFVSPAPLARLAVSTLSHTHTHMHTYQVRGAAVNCLCLFLIGAWRDKGAFVFLVCHRVPDLAAVNVIVRVLLCASANGPSAFEFVHMCVHVLGCACMCVGASVRVRMHMRMPVQTEDYISSAFVCITH